jgi:hypothetical protein
VNGNLGFRGTVASLKVVSIKDTNNGSLATNDDRSYLGVQIGGLTADLIGLESILVFHAGNVNVAVNKATDADNIAATVPAKLDWDSLTTTGMSLENLSIDRALDIHADGSVAMNALGGVLVASGSFSLDLGQVSTTAPSNGVSFTNASAVSLSLTGATVFVGTGGSLSNTTATATVVNGSLGFGGSVASLKVVSIKDTNNGSASTTDDRSYLGVEASGLTADLIGLESILEFHAGAVGVKVNKATDTDKNPATVAAKLDWDSLTTSGMTLQTLTIDRALDIHADGSVAMNALSGVLVASGSFSLDLGQVSTTAPNNGTSFTNASAVSLTLSNATVFVGAGGRLSDATAAANVLDGTLGFRGAVNALKVVSIKDTNNGSVATSDDRSYLGVQASGLSADLIGLDGILDFHASNVNVLVNKAADSDNTIATVPAKLDWDSLVTSGMALQSLAIDRALDIHADGSVALSLLGFVVGSASFSYDTRTVDVDQNANGVFSLAEKDLQDATLLTIGLSNLNLFVGVGASLDPAGVPITTGAIGFSVTDGSLGLAIIRANATAIAGDNRSYMATTASLGKASSSACRRTSVSSPPTSRWISTGHPEPFRCLPPAQVPSALDWTRRLIWTRRAIWRGAG